METYAQMATRLKDSPMPITPGMIAAAAVQCPTLTEATVARILEAGLPYSLKHFGAACAVVPELAEHVVDLMLDAAIAAID